METASEVITRFINSRGITREQLKGKKRLRKLVFARIELAKLLYSNNNLTIGQIGVMLHRSWWQIRYYVNDDMRNYRRLKMRTKKRLKKWKFSVEKSGMENHHIL